MPPRTWRDWYDGAPNTNTTNANNNNAGAPSPQDQVSEIQQTLDRLNNDEQNKMKQDLVMETAKTKMTEISLKRLEGEKKLIAAEQETKKMKEAAQNGTPLPVFVNAQTQIDPTQQQQEQQLQAEDNADNSDYHRFVIYAHERYKDDEEKIAKTIDEYIAKRQKLRTMSRIDPTMAALLETVKGPSAPGAGQTQPKSELDEVDRIVTIATKLKALGNGGGSDIEQLIKFMDLEDRIKKRLVGDTLPAHASQPVTVDPTVQLLKEGYEGYVKSKIGNKEGLPQQPPEQQLIETKIGDDGKIQVNGNGAMAKLTPAEFIELQKVQSNVRIEERKANQEIDRGNMMSGFVTSVLGPAFEAGAEVLKDIPASWAISPPPLQGEMQQRQQGQGQQSQQLGQQADGKFRSECPDCQAVGVHTMLLVDNPKNGEQYACPMSDKVHPLKPWIVWKDPATV